MGWFTHRMIWVFAGPNAVHRSTPVLYISVMPKDTPHKILLTEDEMPTQWYNIVPDLPEPPPPPLHPGTLQPARGITIRAMPIGEHAPEAIPIAPEPR